MPPSTWRVDFIPFDRAEHDDHDQTAQRGQCEILTDDLYDRDDDGRAEHDIVAVFELFRDFLRGRGIGFQIIIFARPAVEHEYCGEQTEQHGDAMLQFAAVTSRTVTERPFSVRLSAITR